MTCGIYMIQNTTNGKIYIGQAIDIEKRWKRHVWELDNNRHINKHLQNAWNKDKKENFEFSIMCECEENQLNTLEEYYIFTLESYIEEVGYNKTCGGSSGRLSTETKNKMSEAQKGHLTSKETRIKLSKAHKGKNYGQFGENHPMYGKQHSEKTKEKMRENHKGFLNKQHTEETKKKMSESHKGDKCYNYGKHLSEETKEKLSKAFAKENNPMWCKGKKVICIETQEIFPSLGEAERRTGINISRISECCRGIRKSAGKSKDGEKLHWKYIKEDI